MNRTLIIILIAAVLLAGGALAWFFMQRQPDYTPTEAIKAVPVDASVIVETQNLQDMLNRFNPENKVWNALSQAGGIQQFAGNIKQVKSWIGQQDKAGKTLTSQNAIISLHIKGEDQVQAMFMTNMPNKAAAEELISVLQRDSKAHYTLESRIYNNTRVYSLSPKAEKFPPLSFSTYKGIFLLSPSSLLLEEAIRQLDTSVSVLISKDFRQVSSSAGKNTDANLYLNYRKLSDFFGVIVNRHAEGFLNSLNNFAGWSEIDVKIRNNALLMNGFVHPAGKNSNYLQVFRRQDAVDVSLHRYFPANTSAFFMLGVDDFSTYRQDYRKYLKSRGNIHKYEHHINKVDRELKVNMEKLFHDMVDQQMAAVYTNVNRPVNSNNAYALFKIRNVNRAKGHLVEMLKNYASFKGLEFEQLRSDHTLNDTEKFKIYRMPVLKIASKLFGLIFDRTPTNYFMFYDDILVMARSKKALLEYRSMMKREETLTENMRYKDFSHALSSSANFYMYADVSRALDLYKYFLPADVSEYYEANLDIFSQFEAFGLQYVSNKDMIYANGYLKYNPETRLFENLLWEKSLNAGVKTKPVLFRNHYTGAHEIFVQDQENRIYLVDKNQNTLWEKQLKEPIMGEVHQIDYFDNDKVQLFFNTASRLHLIDRKGRYLEGYPIELSAPASNGVSVFDYLGDGEYRFALATVDKRVLLLNKQGEPVEGWQFGETQSEVTAPVQHIRMGNKDFICFSDQDQVYLLHRRGTIRVQPDEQFAKSPRNIFYMEHPGNPEKARFVTTNTAGDIKKIALDGSVTTLETQGFNQSHYFHAEDIDNSGEKDYLFAAEETLIAFNENLEELFTYQRENTFKNAPVIYHFSATNQKIGFAAPEQEELILLNNDGTLYKNFPLKGSSAFSIGFLPANAQNFNLISGTAKGLVVYELQ